MTEVKARIKIIIPGSVMMKGNDCKQSNSYDINVMRLQKGSGKNKEVTVVSIGTRQCKPAVQSINITKEAYRRMYADDNIPSNPSSKHITRSVWGKTSRKHRIEAHLNLIAEHLGGKLDSYEVFED